MKASKFCISGVFAGVVVVVFAALDEEASEGATPPKLPTVNASRWPLSVVLLLLAVAPVMVPNVGATVWVPTCTTEPPTPYVAAAVAAAVLVVAAARPPKGIATSPNPPPLRLAARADRGGDSDGAARRRTIASGGLC